MAIKRQNKTKGVILHSDQGRQYQMGAYRRILAEQGIIQLMSRKGNCLDNAAMESFFGRLKMEWFYKREFKPKEEIVEAVRDYLDYYNPPLNPTEIKRTESDIISLSVLELIVRIFGGRS